MRTFAGMSHKGGTGRSVTLANVAYHLAVSGHSVCLVDLDITSPTLGSVLGMPTYAMGAKPGTAAMPRSVADLLRRPENARTTLGSAHRALVDVWNHSPDLRAAAPPGSPEFALLPGCANVDEAELEYERLADVLEPLGSRFDVVLLDVRSGSSRVSHFLTEDPAYGLIRSWLLHYRWTHQHLSGVENFAERFFPQSDNRFQDRVRLVRTAVPSVEGTGARRRQIDEWNAELRYKVDQWPRQLREIGAIPFDEILLWNETVVTAKHVEGKIANQATFDAFRSLATAVAAMLEASDG